MTSREQEWRMDAYAARLSDDMDESRLLVVAVMTTIDDTGLPRNDVIDLVKSAERPDGGTGWTLPEGMSARAFVHHLIARKALQVVGGDRLACPIPGFRRYLIDKGRTPGPSEPGGR